MKGIKELKGFLVERSYKGDFLRYFHVSWMGGVIHWVVKILVILLVINDEIGGIVGRVIIRILIGLFLRFRKGL